MTAPTSTPPTADGTPSRWNRGRVLATMAVVGMVAMWGYVLYLAFVPGRQPPPDRLEDPSFGRAAQEVCSTALDDVEITTA